MSNDQESTERAVYQILLKGGLDQKWKDWFAGLEVISQDGGETLLTGEVADQAALLGVLDRINSLGLRLLLVVKEGCPSLCRFCSQVGPCNDPAYR